MKQISAPTAQRTFLETHLDTSGQLVDHAHIRLTWHLNFVEKYQRLAPAAMSEIFEVAICLQAVYLDQRE